MEVGDVYVRVVPSEKRPYVQERPVGERIEIEELVTAYMNAPPHARFKVLSGPWEGRKDQWAIVYIEKDYRKEEPSDRGGEDQVRDVA